jgi:O-antigen ligase
MKRPSFLFFLPLTAFLLLAAYGSGIFPWTVIVATVLLCLAGLPWRIPKQKTTGKGSQTVDDRLQTAERETETATTNAKHEALRIGLPTCIKRLSRACSPFRLLLLYLIIMLVPLPASVATRGTGSRAQQHQQVSETLVAMRANGIEHHVTPLFSLTRSRAGTLRFLLLAVMAYAGWTFAANAPITTRIALLRLMLLAGAIMAIAGILGKWVYPQGDALWWWIARPHGRPGPMGGFMNRNHFAGFCAMLAPMAAGVAVHDAINRRPLRMLEHSLYALVLAAGTILSLSRGGLLALLAGFGMLVLLCLSLGSLRVRLALTGTALAFGILAGLLVWQQPQLRERVLSLRAPLKTQSAQDRLHAWRDTLRIWQAYPIVGAGPNAFRVVYPQHRKTSAREAREFAENEYVQWLGETGCVGLLLAGLFAVYLLRDIRHALTIANSQRFVTVGAVAALTTVATHALVDFPLHLALYALTAAFIAGVLRAEGGCHEMGGRDSCRAEASSREKTANRWMADIGKLNIALCLVIAILLCFVDLQRDQSGSIIRGDRSDTARALVAAPTAPLVWRRLAALLWQSGTPAQRQLSAQCLTQAATYDPNNYPLWLLLGDRRRALGDKAGAIEAYQRVKALRDWVKVPTIQEEDN